MYLVRYWRKARIVIGKRVLVHEFVSALVSINDTKNERIPKVNVPEQSSQSISIPIAKHYMGIGWNDETTERLQMGQT